MWLVTVGQHYILRLNQMSNNAFQQLLDQKLIVLNGSNQCRFALKLEEYSKSEQTFQGFLNISTKDEKVILVLGLIDLIFGLYTSPDTNNKESQFHKLFDLKVPIDFECKPYIGIIELRGEYPELYVYFKKPFAKKPGDKIEIAEGKTIFQFRGNDFMEHLVKMTEDKYQVIRPIWNYELNFWEFPENLEELIN
jgi:hypothetical protein